MTNASITDRTDDASARRSHTLTLRVSIVACVTVAMATAGASVLHQRSSRGPIDPRTTFDERIDRIEAALARNDLVTARGAVPSAEAAAVEGRHWEQLLEVGELQRRIDQASGVVTPGRASTRSKYLSALVAANEGRSLEGVLHVADAFYRLGDTGVVQHALVMARDLAGENQIAQARVDIGARGFRSQ
jgi:hypothetical protein